MSKSLTPLEVKGKVKTGDAEYCYEFKVNE